ncbi:hypothetical protein V9T40_014750 [Parthenolecanium corni]|uniref:Uncharacterized protein n=1 Tax=Parthenolecanium corni TaxID=536013 RepID=A0AAN9XXZ0_9HEMI
MWWYHGEAGDFILCTTWSQNPPTQYSRTFGANIGTVMNVTAAVGVEFQICLRFTTEELDGEGNRFSEMESGYWLGFRRLPSWVKPVEEALESWFRALTGFLVGTLLIL